MILPTLAAIALQTAPPADNADHGDPNAPTERAVPAVDYVSAGRDAVRRRLEIEQNKGRARNVILFVGDGMDVTTTSAARILAGQLQGSTGEETVLNFETLPYTALSKTYNVDSQVPDSAGTATALMSGQKTRIGVVNVDQSVERGDCEAAKAHRLPTIADLGASMGKSVGVVTTTRLTHATPAALYAFSPDRDWESDADIPKDADCPDIARQLVERRETLNLRVALGGGATMFTPNGKRRDGRNLAEEWARTGTVVRTEAELDRANLAEDGPVLGLFSDSHLTYRADKDLEANEEPTLAEMTRFAIEALSREDDGYVLLVEGGRIDHAHHDGNAARALREVIAFDEAVEVALEAVDLDETLIIVTADHGHTISFQGYPRRGNPILGIVQSAGQEGDEVEVGADGQPFTTLTYANGPGAIYMAKPGRPRPRVTAEEAQSLDYLQQAAVPDFSESHGGQDVAIYAAGPGAWVVSGVMEQNVVYYVIENALRTGE